jgi:hypothetical protein
MARSLSKSIYFRVILGVVVAAIGATAWFGLLDRAVAPITAPLDERAEDYLETTLARAAVTFAAARGLNAIVSVIQDTELALSPAGVGVTVAVGEVVDPLNDLLERFSWVMLASSVSLGIQRVLMEVGVWLGSKILAVAMIFVLAGLIVSPDQGGNLKSIGLKLVLAALVIRFGLPIAAVGGEKVHDLFLKDTYETSYQDLEKTKDQIENQITITPHLPESEENNLLERLRETYEETRRNLDLENRLAWLKDKTVNAVQYIMNLAIVFVLQTMVIPLLTLWALIRLVRLFGSVDIISRGKARTISLAGGEGA